MKTVWVLLWKYYDGFGVRVVGVYELEERGILDFELVKEQNPDKEYFLDEIPFFEGE